MVICTLRMEAPPDVVLKRWQTMMQASLMEAAIHWHRKFAPRHFTTRAKVRYNYKPRSRKHQMRKRKKFGHLNYLVWSGRSREQLTRLMRLTASGGRRGKGKVTGRFVAPRYFFRRPAGHPDKFDEFSRMLLSERKDQARLADKELQRQLRHCERVVTTRRFR